MKLRNRNFYKELIQKAGAETELVYMKASKELLQKRLYKRNQVLNANSPFVITDSGNEDITPEWIEWALKKADWYDPSIATEDEYLGKRQHEKSAEEKEKFLQDSIRKSWYW